MLAVLIVCVLVIGFVALRRRTHKRKSVVSAKAATTHAVRLPTAARFPRPMGRKGKR